MYRFSATFRITIGLSCLVMSVMLAAGTVGLLPDPRVTTMKERGRLCEAIALHCSMLASHGDVTKMEASLAALAKRNPDILSAAVRGEGGDLLAEVGDHVAQWQAAADGRSTESCMFVPITAGESVWGTVEVRFTPLAAAGLFGFIDSPLAKLSAFVGVASVVVFFFYLRKMLQHLDPSKVIPDRVRAALDTLAEGLLVLDRDERIVLANQAFAKHLGQPAQDLQGTHVDRLPWAQLDETGDSQPQFPWANAISDGEARTGVMLGLRPNESEQRMFMVNSSPIVCDDGQCRGVLASFGDVTLLKKKQAELVGMLETLKKSREEIRRQNEELQILATRDPLTSCLNRRSFLAQFETEWASAQRYAHPLSCVMLDIDHFKSINDEFGHSVGDQVLQKVAAALRTTVRDGDLVCRYGGEEFCILLPHLDKDGARAAAERYRKAVATVRAHHRSITISLGVSAISLDAHTLQELLDQADKSLYIAKRSGRNRVVSWDEVPEDVEIDETKGSRTRPVEEPNFESSIPFHAVTALISALSYRDSATAEHSRRVGDLCVATANGLMSLSDAYVLEIAALLHDIGKIGVPDSILLKPGALTAEEWKTMHFHDRIGVEIIRSTFASDKLTLIIMNHHARYDGAGAEQNLPAGDDIPLGARILMIADAFDAMVSDRVYRKGRSQAAAFAELRRCAGKQFDGKLVERFIETVKSRDENRVTEVPAVSKQTALRIGMEIERLARSLDNHDISGLGALASRLKATATKSGVAPVAELAARLEHLAANDPDLAALVRITNDLMAVCRSTQKAYLKDDESIVNPEAAEEALDMLDGAAEDCREAVLVVV
jgi:diguanylate cyclase (GGDEF)-like protein/putative nucleotidyltransferase with HDIG domain/PAS domain S-box-containing protein